MSESFHALPRYAPTPRSLRAMCWLVLLIAAGNAANLAFYFFVLFAGVRIPDDRMLLWAAIVGSFVTVSLLPGAAFIALEDMRHSAGDQRRAPRQKEGIVATLLTDLEGYPSAVLKRSDWLVAVLLIGLAMEFAGIAFLIIGFEQVIVDWIGLVLAQVLIIEGFIVSSGAAGLLAQIVLERLPRRRHRLLICINRPLFVHGMWIAVPVAVVSWGGCPTVLYLCWFGMAAITLSSVVTCVFAHLALRRASRQTT